MEEPATDARRPDLAAVKPSARSRLNLKPPRSRQATDIAVDRFVFNTIGKVTSPKGL